MQQLAKGIARQLAEMGRNKFAEPSPEFFHLDTPKTHAEQLARVRSLDQQRALETACAVMAKRNGRETLKGRLLNRWFDVLDWIDEEPAPVEEREDLRGALPYAAFAALLGAALFWACLGIVAWKVGR